MKRLALLGASDHGKVVADAALLCGWDEVTFFDDAWPGLQHNGPWAVAGDSAVLLAQLSAFHGVLVSIGDCAVRRERQQMLGTAGATLAIVIHPSATVSRHVLLGPGSVVMAGAVVNIDAVIGPAAIINTGATVDHDCHLGDAVHVSPGAHLSGNVHVGQCSWIGTGASVKHGVEIGANVVVGAGSVVISHVTDGLTVVGNPARALAVRSS